MTSTVTKIDWDAVEARLASRTDDAAVLEAFARMRESGDIGTTFMEWVIRTDASLDWLFFERGLPFMPNVA
jgi:hypothetical protein